MNKAGYAYAVAAVRARTERLFSAEEAAWLWTADEPAVKRALQNKGWQTDRPAEEMARARTTRGPSRRRCAGRGRCVLFGRRRTGKRRWRPRR